MENIGDVQVEIGEDYVVSHFPDGAQLRAQAVYDEQSFAHAKELGYGEGEEAVRAMTRDHDVLHHRLAQARGQGYSPTLHLVATGQDIPHELGHEEECLVFLLQRIKNGL